MDMDMKTGVIPYSTDDTDLAAYLFALGAKIPALDRSSDPRRVTYIFELTEEQTEAVRRFHEHTAVVMPQAFADAKKKLVRLIKQGGNND